MSIASLGTLVAQALPGMRRVLGRVIILSQRKFRERSNRRVFYIEDEG
jgi:hypothetical protein